MTPKAKPKGKAPQPKAKSATTMILDPTVDVDMRKNLLLQVVHSGHPETDAVVGHVLEAATNGNGKEAAKEKAEEYAQLISELKSGPLRFGTFVCIEESLDARRALVLLEDGTAAYCVLHDDELAKELERGDLVLIEAQGHAVLFKAGTRPDTGEEAVLERRIDPERIEVTLRDQGKSVFWCTARLARDLDAGRVEPGDAVVVCTQRKFALTAVPKADGHAHYRYLVRTAVPDVVPERDIGAPPAFIAEHEQHVRDELTDPAPGRKYGVRRSKQTLLVGVTGSGKSLGIQATHNRVYAVMSEVTGVPVADLPPRVLRLRAPQVLSQWLGESDKNLDRFFDECEALADEPFVAPDGRVWQLPVLVIFEEVDSLGRRRGGDSIHDRIQTTFLERLDTTCRSLADKLILMLFTSNVPELVDAAFLRRIGGNVIRYGRLDRPGFRAVFEKHAARRPFRRENGETADAAMRRIGADLESWLFAANGPDGGQIDVSLVGTTDPLRKYRRDFLTGSVVDRAMQQAAAAACRGERQGDPEGIDTALLQRAFHDQVMGITEQLDVHNVHDYVSLPEGRRVASVRRLPQPSVLADEARSRRTRETPSSG